MNESEEPDPYRWVGLESATAHAIREIDAEHTIIASVAHYDSLGDLLVTEPIDDTNVIYTFYEPYPFTHQGATWGSIEWNYFKDIPYPATSSQITERMKNVSGDSARYQRICMERMAGTNRRSASALRLPLRGGASVMFR
ncbi:MAG: cellulase family glycosylhydrolase [Acidobacteriaceae bacterium]